MKISKKKKKVGFFFPFFYPSCEFQKKCHFWPFCWGGGRGGGAAKCHFLDFTKSFVYVFFIIIVNIARNDTLYLIYVIILLSLFGRSSSLLVISFALTVLRYFSMAANLAIPQMASVALLQYPYTSNALRSVTRRSIYKVNQLASSARLSLSLVTDRRAFSLSLSL